MSEERALWLADMVAQGYIPVDLMTAEELADWCGGSGRACEIYQKRVVEGTAVRDPKKLKHYPSGEPIL